MTKDAPLKRVGPRIRRLMTSGQGVICHNPGPESASASGKVRER